MRFRTSPRRLRIAALATATALGVVVVLVLRLPFAINTTGSLPIGLYRRDAIAGTIPRGATVALCPPPAQAKLFLDRGYLDPGSCPGGTAEMLKLVAAVPGDTVDYRAEGVWVNGVRLPNSRPSTVDSHGRPMRLSPFGKHVVPAGSLWLWTPSPRSLDSRYLGLVAESDVLARERLLLAFSDWPFTADLPADPP